MVGGRGAERWELVDGLRIMVMTNRSSAGGEFDGFRLGEETFRNEEKVDFGLWAAVREEIDGVGDGVERSGLDGIILSIAESGESSRDVDAVLERETK